MAVLDLNRFERAAAEVFCRLEAWVAAVRLRELEALTTTAAATMIVWTLVGLSSCRWRWDFVKSRCGWD